MGNLRRTLIENYEGFVVVAVSGSIVIGLLLAALADKVCFTIVCQEVSINIKSSLDTKIDPCDDFYEFACGTLLKDERKTTESDSIILAEAEANQRDKVTKLMREHASSTTSVSLKVQAFLSMCEEKGVLDQASKELPEIAKDKSLFPSVVGKFEENSWSLLSATEKLRKIGLDCFSLFEVTVFYDPLNPRKIILSVRNPDHFKFNLAKCDEACKADYVYQYKHTLAAFTDKIKEGGADAKNVMEFEKILVTNAIKYQNEHDNQNLLNCKKPLSILNDKFGFVDWVKYIKIVLGNNTLAKNISADMKILVLNADYLTQLTKLFSETSSRVMANYMMWYALRPLTARSCLSWVEETMPISLQKTYLGRYASYRRKIAIQEMVEYMRENIMQSIWNMDWLDEEDKRGASRQINETFLRLPSSDSLSHFDLNKFYEGVDLNGDFRFILDMNRNLLDKKLELLVTGVERKSWDMILFVFEKKVYSVDRFYIAVENSLTILDGFLKRPVHDEDWPPYLNYGRLGSAVGHTLSHSLSFKESQYDTEGRRRKWWLESTREKFMAKESCFREHHKSFTSSNESNVLTDIEFMADSTSLRLGFEAYRKLEDSSIFPDLLLPNMPYTQEQLFFISFAQLHCNKDYRPILSNGMPSGRFRVVGSVQNNKYFSEAFGCKENATMNPSKKCMIWN